MWCAFSYSKQSMGSLVFLFLHFKRELHWLQVKEYSLLHLFNVFSVKLKWVKFKKTILYTFSFHLSFSRPIGCCGNDSQQPLEQMPGHAGFPAVKPHVWCCTTVCADSAMHRRSATVSILSFELKTKLALQSWFFKNEKPSQFQKPNHFPFSPWNSRFSFRRTY